MDTLLRTVGKCLKDYPQLPQPPLHYLSNGLNNLILDETSYDCAAMEMEYKKLFSNCNEEQRDVYNDGMQSVEQQQGGVFFVYGGGGCGKTYIWRTLIFKLRSIKLE